MGGINHQPCGSYLENSTRLSRAMSLARSEFELGNASLEKLLLLEMGGESIEHRREEYGELKQHLATSMKYLGDMGVHFSELRDQMDRLEFVDQPMIDLDEFGTDLVSMYLVDPVAMIEISEFYQEGGFQAALSCLEDGQQHLVTLTGNLWRSIIGLSQAVMASELAQTLEDNRVGNIRRPFAELYSAWSSYQQQFLASSLISTEQWYRSQGHGSLVSDRQTASASA